MLASLVDFKNYLGFADVTDQDDALVLVLTGADAWIRSYCGREFETTRYCKDVDATNPYTCWVPDFPLTRVYAITTFNSILDTTGIPLNLSYVRFYEKGMIYSEEAIFVPSVPGSVRIDYAAGYELDSTSMKTLKWICLEVAAQMYRNRGIFNLSTYDAGGVQFQKYASDIWPLLGPEVMALLASFKTLGPREDM